MDKLNSLVAKIKENGEGYLMFSGGLDSCAILGAAAKANVRIIPVWINNGFGRAEENDIKCQAKNMGSNNLNVIELRPNAQVVKNPEDRCYFCKSQIVLAIKQLANGLIIMDGTTGSDIGYRPGKKALNEQGVISPLSELGISSAEAKEIALSLGADKYIAQLESCMATRVNYKLPLVQNNMTTLRKIERLVIAETNDYNIRCRLDDADHIRIELSASESFLAIANNNFRERLVALGEKVALFTTIDLKPARPNVYDKRITQ